MKNRAYLPFYRQPFYMSYPSYQHNYEKILTPIERSGVHTMTKTPKISSDFFLSPSVVSPHHKLNGTISLSTQTKCVSCLMSCRTIQGLENEESLG